MTADELGGWLGVSSRTVTDLAQDEIVARVGRGRYDLKASITRYCGHLREMAAGRASENGSLDVVQERARLAKEQADAQEMKNALARGDLVSVEAVGLEVEREYAVVKERLLTVPGKIADALVGLSRAEIEAALIGEVTEALDELHVPGVVVDRAVASSDAAGEGEAGAEAAAAAEPGGVG